MSVGSLSDQIFAGSAFASKQRKGCCPGGGWQWVELVCREVAEGETTLARPNCKMHKVNPETISRSL